MIYLIYLNLKLPKHEASLPLIHRFLEFSVFSLIAFIDNCMS